VYTYPASGAGSTQPHAESQLAGGTTNTYHYDAQGNLTSASGGAYRSITYTSFNLPDSQSGVQGAVSMSYTWLYDENHARVKETRVSTVATTVTASGPSGYTAAAGQVAAGTRVTWYVHPDNVGGLAYEYECETATCPPATSVSRHYLTAGGTVIGMLQSVGTPVTPSGTAPPTITSITLNKVEYWHKDHLGSLIATTDHTGAVTARYSYDPFGKHRYPNGAYDMNGVLIADYTTATSSGTARGFTGHEELDDVGLINMNGRLYDPVLGRFVQADPFVQFVDSLQSFNGYSYALNNPLGFADPSGFEVITITAPYLYDDPYTAAAAVIVDVAISFGDAIGCFLFGCDTPTPKILVIHGPVTPISTSESNLHLTQSGQPNPNISGPGSDASPGPIGGGGSMGTPNSGPSSYATDYVDPPGQRVVVMGSLPDAGPGSVAGGVAAASASALSGVGQQPIQTITIVGHHLAPPPSVPDPVFPPLPPPNLDSLVPNPVICTPSRMYNPTRYSNVGKGAAIGGTIGVVAGLVIVHVVAAPELEFGEAAAATVGGAAATARLMAAAAGEPVMSYFYGAVNVGGYGATAGVAGGFLVTQQKCQ